MGAQTWTNAAVTATPSGWHCGSIGCAQDIPPGLRLAGGMDSVSRGLVPNKRCSRGARWCWVEALRLGSKTLSFPG